MKFHGVHRHRSHQTTVRRWCRKDKHLDAEIQLIASKLEIKYRL